MERVRWCKPDQNNGTTCIRMTTFYPTRITFNGNIATEASADTTSSVTILLEPQLHFNGLGSWASELSMAESTTTASPLVIPLGSILSATDQVTLSTDSIIESSAIRTYTAPMVISTLATINTPSTASSVTSTPISVPTSTISSTSVETYATSSSAPVSGVEMHTSTGPNRGAIAGGVVAAVAIAVVSFAIFMCCRRRRRRSAGSGSNPTWKQIEEAEKAEMLSVGRKTEGGDAPDKKHSSTQQTTIPRADSSNTLGEPGPSLDMDGNQRSVLPYMNSRTDHRYTISNRSNDSGISDPFATPTESTQDADSSLDACEPTRSQIGLALSRYSTTTIKAAPEVVQHKDVPALPHSSPVIPLVETPKANTEDENSMRLSTVNHKRASSISATTDGAEGETSVISVGKAVTARRHSLTPRLISIMAGDSRSDDGQRVSRANSRSDNDLGRKSFNRTRSASPSIALDRYTGSPAKLNGHFGIETWGMQPGRTSSEHSVKRNGETSLKSTAEIKMDRQSSTKSNLHRPEYLDATEHRHYPPTSFPVLDRSLSQAKKRLREQSMENLGRVVQLPDSVTVERRHKRV